MVLYPTWHTSEWQPYYPKNGKLVGAVTHVLVDDPARGYGIFAENMLETAQSVVKENKLKDAS